MSVIDTSNAGAREFVAPMDCDHCGGTLRLVGIEPHHTLAATDVFTYTCTKCDTTQVLAVPCNPPEAPNRR